tara:strand:+ start:360 stop:884 length:525 start_codon:yes stop_codon:yes gene_type:complete
MITDIQKERFNKAAQYFGKFNIKDSLKGAYLSVMDEWKPGLFDAVMDYVETNEALERFPEPFQLDRLGKRIRQTLLSDYFEKENTICYYCSNTGYVPEIIYPQIYKGNSVLANLPCKCTRGNTIMMAKDGKGEPMFVQGYFDRHTDIQIEDKIEGFDYSHVVYKHYSKKFSAVR